VTAPIGAARLAQEVAEKTDRPSELRVGTVTAVTYSVVTCEVAGGTVEASRLASYMPAIGEPCVLMMVGDSWIALHSVYGAGSPASVRLGIANYNQASSGDTTSSTSFVDMSGTGLVFVKRSPISWIRLKLAFSAFASVNLGVMIGGIRLTGITGTNATGYSIDVNMTQFFFNAINRHDTTPDGETVLTGAPDGSYIVFGRWRRGAAGTIVRDSNDWVGLTVEEIVS
jgi:hypothetical protein